MGVYIEGLDMPKGETTELIIRIQPNGEIRDSHGILLKARAEDIDLVRCGECIHFHYDKPYIIQGIPVLGHEVCDFWGDGCKTNPNGFCSYGERRADET